MIDRISSTAVAQAFAQIRPVDGGIQVPAIRPGESVQGPSFGDTLKQFVTDVSATQDAAGDLRARFLRGENVELHQVMAAGEEAGIALDLMVEMRNKVTEAYRTLVSMQS
jgi:flagellar hook-basal body complex protein FliE